MRAASFNSNFKFISGSHDWTGARAELTHWHAGQIMHAIDFGDAETRHHTVINHGFATTATFFSRLKNHRHFARKIPCLSKIFCSAEQHRRMAIMTTGMHFARHS